MVSPKAAALRLRRREPSPSPSRGRLRFIARVPVHGEGGNSPTGTLRDQYDCADIALAPTVEPSNSSTARRPRPVTADFPAKTAATATPSPGRSGAAREEGMPESLNGQSGA